MEQLQGAFGTAPLAPLPLVWALGAPGMGFLQ